MKLFISWSGEFSKKIAECLSLWIPTIIQTVDVFYSPNDIAKGENWSSRLSKELEQSNFGIICLTPENILAPWLHFEAGALSKISDSRVSAIMLGVSPSDIKGPLARFQNTAFNREDFYRLFQSINNSHQEPLKQAVLDHAFNNSWENLERDITAIVEEYSSQLYVSAAKESQNEEHNSDRDALQEILAITRTLNNNLSAYPQTSASPIPQTDVKGDLFVHIFIAAPLSLSDAVTSIIERYCYDICLMKAYRNSDLYICLAKIAFNQVFFFKQRLYVYKASVEILNW